MATKLYVCFWGCLLGGLIVDDVALKVCFMGLALAALIWDSLD